MPLHYNVIAYYLTLRSLAVKRDAKPVLLVRVV